MTKLITRSDTADRGRFSARRKTEAVLRLLRGEDLETLSRQLGGTAARRCRLADERGGEIARMRSKVGQLTMDNELLGQNCQHLEAGRPFVTRRRSG